LKASGEDMTDILIIGGGVIGCSIARELSKYSADITLVEKNIDVCEETSKANSGIAHSGYDALPGTLKAKYNVLGSKMLPKLCHDLQIPYKQNGSLILGFSEDDKFELEKLLDQGLQNGVEGLSILNQKEILALEPNLNPSVKYALYAQTGGIVDPFQLTIAQAEVAYLNVVTFQMNTEVKSVRKVKDHFVVSTNRGDIECKVLVNAAGLFSDDIHNMLSSKKLKIVPRKGEYCLFDKQVSDLVKATIFQLPTSAGKGVLVTPTAEGNLLVGPSSQFVEAKEDKETTRQGIQYVLETAKLSVPNIPLQYIITGFAGLRASEVGKDFIIGEAEDVENLFEAAGIESPGLTAAPAIGQELAQQIAKRLKLSEKPHYVKTRKNIVRFEDKTNDERRQLIDENHEYGKIICRCEMVTLAEIKNAITRPIGATTLDGVKRRTRATAGRCQGGFCGPKILEILAEELRKDPKEIAKFSEKSTLLIGLDKEI